MEYNQELSMGLWIECGNIDPYFALKARNEIYIVAYTTVMELIRKGKKQLNLEDMSDNASFYLMFCAFVGCMDLCDKLEEVSNA